MPLFTAATCTSQCKLRSLRTRKCPPVRFVLSSLSIAMGYRDSARGIRCFFYLDHSDFCWFARAIRRTCVVSLVFRRHVEINVNATFFRVRLSLSNYFLQHTSIVSKWTPLATPVVYNAATPCSMVYHAAGVPLVVNKLAGTQVLDQVVGAQV